MRGLIHINWFQEKYGGFVDTYKMSTSPEIQKVWASLRNYYRILLKKITGPGTSGNGANGK